MLLMNKTQPNKEGDQFASPQLLADIARDDYLGSPDVIQSVLRVMAMTFLRHRIDQKDDSKPEDRAAFYRDLATGFTATFLGKDPNFTPIKDWNKPGCIDEWCAAVLPIADTEPEKRMGMVALLILTELNGILLYAITDGVLDEQWNWQFDALFDQYTKILLGIPVDEEPEPTGTLANRKFKLSPTNEAVSTQAAEQFNAAMASQFAGLKKDVSAALAIENEDERRKALVALSASLPARLKKLNANPKAAQILYKAISASMLNGMADAQNPGGESNRLTMNGELST